MSFTIQLAVEALVVGLVTAIIGLGISTAIMYASQRDFSLKKYHFWPYILLAFFITGLVCHLGFEVLGANKWYCRKGNACTK